MWWFDRRCRWEENIGHIQQINFLSQLPIKDPKFKFFVGIPTLPYPLPPRPALQNDCIRAVFEAIFQRNTTHLVQFRSHYLLLSSSKANLLEQIKLYFIGFISSEMSWDFQGWSVSNWQRQNLTWVITLLWWVSAWIKVPPPATHLWSLQELVCRRQSAAGKLDKACKGVW